MPLPMLENNSVGTPDGEKIDMLADLGFDRDAMQGASTEVLDAILGWLNERLDTTDAPSEIQMGLHRVRGHVKRMSTLPRETVRALAQRSVIAFLSGK